MNAIWLAAGAAVAWGMSDYFGGVSSRGRSSVFMVLAVSESLGLAALIPVLAVRGLPPANPRLLLAAASGVGVTVELSLIYLALSRGEGFITAPVGALGAAAAAVVGLVTGDPLSLLTAAGLACALGGGGVSAWTSGGGRRHSGPLRSAAPCAGAAAGVATTLVTLHAAGQVDPYWAAAIEHASTGICAVLIELVANRQPGPARLPAVRQLPGLALVAFVGVAGDVAYAVASQHGSLSVLSTISSLYPVATIALGIGLQRQRPGPVQVAGITLALAGAAILGFTTG